MTAEDRACAVQLLRAAAADHLTHLDPAERDELVERISAAIERCGRRREIDAWDEGFNAGWDGGRGEGWMANPYRETT